MLTPEGADMAAVLNYWHGDTRRVIWLSVECVKGLFGPSTGNSVASASERVGEGEDEDDCGVVVVKSS